jgi:hypothetical protein
MHHSAPVMMPISAAHGKSNQVTFLDRTLLSVQHLKLMTMRMA